jgi:hypothetical protein
MSLRLAAAVLALGAAGTAQARFWIDDPAELDTARHGNNLIPLGSVAAGPLRETRWLQLVPARSLPPLRCRLEAISVAALMGGVELRYALLRIDLAATRAETLVLEPDANLPAPMTVLHATDRAIRWPANEITRLDFDAAFPHDGTSGLVLDIHKVVDAGAADAHVNMKTTETVPGAPQRTVFVSHLTDPARRKAHTHPLALLVRLHFAAREAFGLRIAAGMRADRSPPPRRGRPAAGGAPAPAGIVQAEAGVTGAAGSWRVVRFRLDAGTGAAEEVAVRIGPGGIGMAAVTLPAARELLGTALEACPASPGPLGGWEPGVTLRVAR